MTEWPDLVPGVFEGGPLDGQRHMVCARAVPPVLVRVDLSLDPPKFYASAESADHDWPGYVVLFAPDRYVDAFRFSYLA